MASIFFFNLDLYLFLSLLYGTQVYSFAAIPAMCRLCFADEDQLKTKKCSRNCSGSVELTVFRVSGDSDLSQKLKVELNSYAACNPPEGDKFWLSYDTHVLAGVLKQWLRQLDEPLIPMELYSQCIACVSNNDVIGVVKLINSHQMYEPNKTVLRYLIAFLQVKMLFVLSLKKH